MQSSLRKSLFGEAGIGGEKPNYIRKEKSICHIYRARKIKREGMLRFEKILAHN